MTKLIINTNLNINWLTGIEDRSKEEAMKWLQDNIPAGAFLEVYHGYDNAWGETYTQREETDEEYSERLDKEKAKLEERELDRAMQANLLQNKINILKGQDLALSSYLEKHKDNPRVGDLENLFMTLAQANMNGATGVFVKQIQDCMAALENV